MGEAMPKITFAEARDAATALRQIAQRNVKRSDRGLWTDAHHKAISRADAFARVADWIEEAARDG